MNTPEDLKNLIKEQKDILWGLYQENYAHARHHETQRSTITNIIIVTSAGLASVASAGGIHVGDWPLGGAMILVGIFGALFTAIHFERSSRYRYRADEYYKELDALLFEKGRAPRTLKDILKAADFEFEAQHRVLHETTHFSLLRILWPLLISIIGALLMGYCIYLYKTQNVMTP